MRAGISLRNENKWLQSKAINNLLYNLRFGNIDIFGYYEKVLTLIYLSSDKNCI